MRSPCNTRAVETVPFEFTAHNIELPDGRRTRPGEALLRDWGICKAALRSLAFFVPIADPAQRPRVVDLGCCEGGYAVEFARAGYDVLGIEGRASNIEKCNFVAERVQLPNLRFVHDDVRNIQSYGSFDAVFCCGLLYHLDKPVASLRQLADATWRVLLLQTHYATDDDESWDRFQLSPMTLNEGRLGRWYQEWSPDTPPEEIEKFSWSSVGNSSSFWLEKRHLLQAMIDVGFSVVCEQFDFLDDVAESDYTEDQHRSLFLGVKGPIPDAYDGAGGKAREQDSPQELANLRATVEARERETRRLEGALEATDSRLVAEIDRARTLAEELATAQEQARALEHELGWIKATRLWRVGTRWWGLKQALRGGRSG